MAGRKRKKHRLLRALGALVLLGILCFGGLVGYVVIRESSVVREAAALEGNYDAIIVLGAQVLLSGEPNTQLQWRLDAAAEAWRLKNVPIAVCGAQGKDEPLPEAEAMRNYLVKQGILGVVIVVLALIMAIFPAQIAPYDPTAVDITARTKAPSAAHIFGTDNYGRDIFSRVVWGTRIDLSIGFFGVLVPLIVGSLIGLLAAWYGGWLDSLLMRISEIMMAFPFTILVIAIITILGTGTINLYIALWLVGWMSYARLVRAEVLTLKKSEFIEAARVAGFSDARILLRHVLPNVISSSIVFAASDMVMCMLTGASMSFLGLGVQPPTPEWGAILNEGRTYITYASWMTFFPGLVLAITGVGLSLLGDSMTDILRRKGR